MTSVINPPHYTAGGIECIDYLEAKLQGRDGFEGFCIGNAIKYLTRADMKGPGIEDYKKARWYVDRLIANREAADAEVDAEVAAMQLDDDEEEADEWALPEGFEWDSRTSQWSAKSKTLVHAVLQTDTGYMVYFDEDGQLSGSLTDSRPDLVELVKRRNGVTP